MMSDFKNELEQEVEFINDLISRYLPDETGLDKKIREAMNYSVNAGGKRVRPMLMLEVYKLCGGDDCQVVYPFMAALECIHSYSLVHDDLPAMDNDEYRRGRKTTWTVYGEGMAVLAGDGLLNYAYETAAKAFDKADDLEEMKRVARALQILAEKAGIYGMIGGQNGDLEAEEGKLPLTEELLLFIHEKKTAALIQAALMIGGILAGASDTEIRSLEKAAYDIGIAFQIQDDILDVTGNEKILGKPIGSDEKNHKLTYVSLNGLEKSKEDVKRLSGEAEEILSSFQEKNPFLISLIDSLITRQK